MSGPTALGLSAAPAIASVDGTWSTFLLQVGTPPQGVNVLVSTAQSIDYVITTSACQPNASLPVNQTCADSRGGVFNSTSSTTWNATGRYSLQLESFLNLDAGANAPYSIGQYGTDVIRPGYEGAGDPELADQIVVYMAYQEWWLGYLGILPEPYNFAGNVTQNTYVETLFTQNKIPSKTWGFTAGSLYLNNNNGPTASLTFGGYDENRFTANGVSFPMNFSTSQQQILSLELSQITLGSNASSSAEVLREPIIVSLDSTLPYAWLPPDVCEVFQHYFNLTYNSDLNLYTLTEAARFNITGQNPPPSLNFTFTQTKTNQTVNITVPYVAFDLIAQPPVSTEQTYYFPIKQAPNSSYVLGRAFLQEAYIFADFDNFNFTLSQAVFPADYQPALVTVNVNTSTAATSPSPSPTPSHGGSSNAGAIAGGVVGGVVGAALIALLIWFFIFRRNKKARQAAAVPEDKPVAPLGELHEQTRPLPPEKNPNELEGGFGESPGTFSHGHEGSELASPGSEPFLGASELSGSRRYSQHNATYELQGSTPAPAELSGDAENAGETVHNAAETTETSELPGGHEDNHA